MNYSENGLPEPAIETDPCLTARALYSGFDWAHDTYNALTRASDGKIYYVLSSNRVEQAGVFCSYDPATGITTTLGDLNELCGEAQGNAVPQGKSHVEFYEWEGKLFFGTHVGYYEMIEGMENLPRNPPGEMALYPGGHLLSYDLATGTVRDLAVIGGGEGVLTMTMDQERGHIYGITWPNGYFFHFDVTRGKLRMLGPVSYRGEAGKPGKDYRVLCRSMFVDPQTAKVYLSTSEGDIFFFQPGAEQLEIFQAANLRLDYFGQYDPAVPGNMAYNWRKIFWHPVEEVAYGVHGNSGYLFRFDPRRGLLEIVDRITSAPSRKSGMFDQFSYGYLGFQLGPDLKTIYYLTGGPVFQLGRRVEGAKTIARGASRGEENLHLVTFHLPTRRFSDHGAVFYADGSRPSYVNSIAVDSDGSVYALARRKHDDRIIQDLVMIPAPKAEGHLSII